MDLSLHWVIRVFILVLFGFSAYGKLRNPSVFFAKMKQYQLLPKNLVPFVGTVFIGIESILPFLFLWESTLSLSVALSVGLLAIFTIAIGINVIKGNTEIDCGCFLFGSKGGSTYLGWNLVLRNGVLMLLVSSLLLPVPYRELNWYDWLQVCFAILVFGVLYIAMNEILTIINKKV